MLGRMGQPERILVADDLEREGGPLLGAPLKLASAVAERLGSEILLVHVYETPKEVTLPPNTITMLEGPFAEQMAYALDQEAEAARKAKPHLKVVTEVEQGETVSTLLEGVQKQNIRIVVVGTHARKGVRRAFLGSVAEEMIRRSPAPVLSVNPHVELGADFHPRKILAAIDPNVNPKRELELAAEFAKAFGARLLVVHVIEEWVYPIVQSASLLAGGIVMPLERDLKELGNARSQQLARLAGPLAGEGVEVDSRIIERATGVGQAIVDEARRESCDLIVMGHRSASRLEYVLLGSVSRYVVREAHCPVLTVGNP
jgi:nucleotide-binding universal stress UspA family protein